MVTPPEVLLFTRLFQISWGFCFFLYEVRCCSFKVCENCVRILMRTVLNMLIAFGKMVIFTILFMRHSVMWGGSLVSEEVCLCSRVTSGCKHLGGEAAVAGACTHIDQSSRNAHTWSLPLLWNLVHMDNGFAHLPMASWPWVPGRPCSCQTTHSLRTSLT